MAKGVVCKCPESKKYPVKDRKWRIIDYKCNYSAFNGWRRQESNYSCLTCEACGAVWRTNAFYVEELFYYAKSSE